MSKLKLIMGLGLCLILAACASYRRAESFQSKMDRYKANTKGRNVVPLIRINEQGLKTAKRSRSIASIKKNKTSSSFSNKRLYFLTLYTQYTQLKKYSNVDSSEISICPNFHSSLVAHKKKFPESKDKNLIDWSYLNKEKLNELSNPILSLPLSETQVIPKLTDYFKKNEFEKTIVQKALNIHVLKTHAELGELCENGFSDNYYAYENLMTYSKSQRMVPSSKNLGILLKTTIFANELIINSLVRKPRVKSLTTNISRSIASYTSNSNPYAYEVHNRLGVDWVINYFNEYKK